MPLHVPGAAAPAVSAHLTYRNGPLIAAAEVFTIFWGSGWSQNPQAALIPELNAFFDAALTSTLVDQLAEYSVPKYAIGHGKRTGTMTIATPALVRRHQRRNRRHLRLADEEGRPLHRPVGVVQ